jgi:hypothetical protein
MRSFFCASILLFSLVACGGDPSPAEQACLDVADAIGKAAQRCGQDYQANFDAFETQLGGCDNAAGVRDEATLRSTCLPSLGTVTCADITAGRIDDSCRAQIQVQL